MRNFVLALFFCGAVALPVSAQDKSRVAPDGWLPALFPSIQNALAQLKEADSKKEMNALSRSVAEMKDAQLYIAYIRLYERLSTKERATLLAEQTKWLKARTKATEEAVESAGSLAPLEGSNAELNMTEERLRELRARLNAIRKKED